jgi:MFS family permease
MEATPPPTDPAGTPARPAVPRRPGLVVATLSLCGIVVSLQQTLLLPLLPELPRLLDTSVDNASWLVTATLLAGAVATPTISRLADMYGKRRMMLVALGASILGSALGAVTTAIPLLVTARALQGVGMALIPVGIAIMRDELPRERLPLGVALMSATLAVGAGIGLPVSGVISEQLDWHATFVVTGVVGAVMLVAVLRVLPESPVRSRGRFDVRGAVVLSAALTAVLVALSKGSQWGWGSATTIGAATAGVALLAVWVPMELRTPSPLVDIRVAARRAVLLVNLAAVLSGFAMFANMLVTTQQLQAPADTGYGLGLSTLEAGLWLTPSAAAFALMAPVSAWTTRRLGPQSTLILGGAVMAVAYATRTFVGDGLAAVVVTSVVISAGTAMTYSAMPTLVMRAVPVTETASANGLNVLLRSLGTSTSSAAVAAITTASAVLVAGVAYPSATAVTVLLWIAAVASVGTAALGVPMLRMADYDDEGAEATGPPTPAAAVIHGVVVSAAGEPVGGAVVTVRSLDGEPVDWGQADSSGDFAVALPGRGRFVVEAVAEGWLPYRETRELDAELPAVQLELAARFQAADVRDALDDAS